MGSYRLHIKWALLFLGTCLCWQVLERILGWHDDFLRLHLKFQFIFLIIAFITFLLALKEIQIKLEFKDKKQIIFNGWILTLIICFLLPAALWILYNYITPNYLDNIVNHTIETGTPSGKATHSINSKVFLTRIPFVMAGSGFLFSIIVAQIIWTANSNHEKV